MKKAILFGTALSIIITLFIVNIQYTRADSGWDSSYDSGSSWSSSDWSSSDWGSSNSYSHSSGSSSGDVDSAFGIFVLGAIAIVIIYLLSASKALNNEDSEGYFEESKYKDVDDVDLEAYGIDRDEFLDMAYDKYVAIQNAWMEFDYTSLKELVTDELYNTYYAQLESLKIKEQKNIMSDFNLIDSHIVNIKKENNILSVTVYLNVKMYDYVVDANNDVIRGNKNRKINITYLIIFVKPLAAKNITNCPNCGGKLNDTAREKCEHCDTIIVKSRNEFVMSKKTNIKQR